VCRPPLNWIFVKPGSGARRATWRQQHAQRFACNIGRQSLAHEPEAAFAERIAVAPRPVKLVPGGAAYGNWPLYRDTITRSMFRVLPWATATLTREPHDGYAEKIAVAPRPVKLVPGGAAFGNSPLYRDTITRSMFRVLPWATAIPRTVERHIHVADVRPTACAMRLRRPGMWRKQVAAV
jgi:hypothetical protein